jgi:Secretion system C-terminal sorting domain
MTKFTLLLVFSTLFIGLYAQPNICDSNIANNPGFENGLADWTNLFDLSQTSTQAHSGTTALEMCKENASRLYQTISITPQKSYIFSAFGRKTGDAPTNIYLKFLDATFQAVAAGYTQINSSDYQSVTVSATTPATASYLEFGFLKDEGVGCLFADDACMVLSDVFIDTKEEEIANSLELFPNPANGEVWISFKNNETFILDSKGFLFNQLGQKVKEFDLKNAQNGLFRLDVSGVPKGIYFVKMEVNGVTMRAKKLVLN